VKSKRNQLKFLTADNVKVIHFRLRNRERGGKKENNVTSALQPLPPRPIRNSTIEKIAGRKAAV
jgi:hypothetical protein